MTLLLKDIVQSSITRVLAQRFEQRAYFPLCVTGQGQPNAPGISLQVAAEGGDIKPTGTLTCKLKLLIADAAEREERILHSLLEVIAVLHGSDFDCRPYVVVDISFATASLLRQEDVGKSTMRADFTISCLEDA